MILSDHFVFLHVPKTGGTFVRRILERYAPKSWNVVMGDDHANRDNIPASHAHLPILGFVRNPYSWYVSWYHFQQDMREPFFLEISEDGALPFGETMRRAILSREEILLGAGPFTQMLQHMFGEQGNGVRYGRMEDMRVDLPRMFGELTEVPAPMREAIESMEKKNTSEHDPYHTYYDDELRELIRERDKVVFELFDYEWLKPY
ncbi:MAG: hypothetical protein AB7O97_07020 [Planctomycetota bacterium]